MAATRDRQAFSTTVLLIAICAVALPAEAKYGGGTGEPNDPYQIWSAEQLNAIGADPNSWDKHFKLMADIDLSTYAETGFNVIGPNPMRTRSKDPSGLGGPFTGAFDGDNHIISNLTWPSARQGPAGLFGCVSGSGGEVRNLVLANPVLALSQDSYGAPLAVTLRGGTLTNCHVRGGRVSGTDYVGGLVRFNDNGTINDCSAEISVEGNDWVGGLVAHNRGTIAKCHAGGNVTGGEQIGGLVGLNEGSITDSHAVGDVNGIESVGGLVGDSYRGTMKGCYATGNVTGEEYVGGLAGDSGPETVDCYSTGSVTGTRYVGGLIGLAPYRIENCCATGDVQGGEYAGGLAGEVFGSLLNCFAEGDVAGDNYIGGLAGHNWGAVTNCYATGSILGPDGAGGMEQVAGDPRDLSTLRDPHGGPAVPATIAGGLVGWNSGAILNSYSTSEVRRTRDAGGLVGIASTSARVTGSFWDVEASGQTASAGGVGKTTAQMRTRATFFGWGAFDSRGAWTIDDGNDYPRLSWENRPGRLIDWPYPAGEGTREAPYQIRTAEELLLIGWFPSQWSKRFELMADVDLSACDRAAFTIGDRTTPFAGVFEGNGHTISNFRYITEDESAAGLFGRVADPNAEIRNLGLIDPSVNAEGGYNVGSLVGYLVRGVVTNCYAKGGTVLGRRCVGGLVGLNDQAAGWPPRAHAFLTECYCTSNVVGDFEVGGLVGWNMNGLIANCYSAGAVDARNSVGGLAGENDGTIMHCYSIGTVAGETRVGGLVGENLGPYATVIASFWDIDASGRPTGPAGVGLRTAAMKTARTFLDAGWDFVDETANGTEDIWWILEGEDYPRLLWEAP
ncbi:MAG: GLUG motif-containing protein [Phycisphaerales bacterium]